MPANRKTKCLFSDFAKEVGARSPSSALFLRAHRRVWHAANLSAKLGAMLAAPVSQLATRYGFIDRAELLLNN
jgi:hypothetical protein